jgi:DNA-binding Lrp family transcriptional regulator
MVVPSKDVGSLGCQASAGVPGAEAAIMTAPDAGTQTASIDDVDRAIVAVLREDGRISMRALAARLHISRAGAYLRVQRLEEAGVITGYTARVDPQRYGYGLSAYVYLKIAQPAWKALQARLMAIPEVEHAALVSGDTDIVLLVRTRDIAALRELVLNSFQSMPEVLSTQTVLIFDELGPGPTGAGGPSRGTPRSRQ